MKAIFETYGWKILDRSERTPKQMCEVPRLVHQSQTMDTTNTMRCIFRAGVGCGGIPDENKPPVKNAADAELKIDPNIVCALLDEHEGLAELNDLADEIGCHLAYVCAAEIYCDLFAEVRSMIRKGHSPRYIQKHIDDANKPHRHQVDTGSKHSGNNQSRFLHVTGSS